jgi:UDP-2,3-diacylglucosamine hydrolase
MPATPLAQPVTQVLADPAWQRIDFISDIHLDEAEPQTFAAWAHYMAHTAADALFILGDLFEVWIGDDNPDAFVQRCTAALQSTAQRLPVYFVCGNRDFLVGADFFARTGVRPLHDPTVLDTGTARFLLSHGDALCLDDHDYLAFRAQVRHPAWQAEFLAKPLAERQAIARHIRGQSEARKQSHTDYADVDTAAAIAWLHAAQAQVMIHGHTHHPAEHNFGQGLQRWVLSDWHANSTPPRLEVLQWQRPQAQSPTRGLCRVPLTAA